MPSFTNYDGYVNRIELLEFTKGYKYKTQADWSCIFSYLVPYVQMVNARFDTTYQSQQLIIFAVLVLKIN